MENEHCTLMHRISLKKIMVTTTTMMMMVMMKMTTTTTTMTMTMTMMIMKKKANSKLCNVQIDDITTVAVLYI